MYLTDTLHTVIRVLAYEHVFERTVCSSEIMIMRRRVENDACLFQSEWWIETGTAMHKWRVRHFRSGSIYRKCYNNYNNTISSGLILRMCLFSEVWHIYQRTFCCLRSLPFLLEFCMSVWTPNSLTNNYDIVLTLENVQSRFTQKFLAFICNTARPVLGIFPVIFNIRKQSHCRNSLKIKILTRSQFDLPGN